MVVVDCNVLVHLLVQGEETARARALLKADADWHSDALIMIELANVLALAVRAKRIAMRDATPVLTQARTVMEPGLHVAGDHDAWDAAHDFRVSAYDARYLAIARELGVPLVTEDAKLRSAAPKITRSLAAMVGY